MCICHDCPLHDPLSMSYSISIRSSRWFDCTLLFLQMNHMATVKEERPTAVTMYTQNLEAMVIAFFSWLYPKKFVPNNVCSWLTSDATGNTGKLTAKKVAGRNIAEIKAIVMIDLVSWVDWWVNFFINLFSLTRSVSFFISLLISLLASVARMSNILWTWVFSLVEVKGQSLRVLTRRVIPSARVIKVLILLELVFCWKMKYSSFNSIPSKMASEDIKEARLTIGCPQMNSFILHSYTFCFSTTITSSPQNIALTF